MYSLLSDLSRPYTLLLLISVLALLNLWRRGGQRRPLLWLTLPLLALVVLSTPAAGYLAVGSLEWRYPPLDERPEDAGAIVVLGGGTLAPDRGRPQAELDPTSLYRCLYAAKLYRQGAPCPVLVIGGKPDPTVPGPAAAELMSDLLVRQGVRTDDVLVEAASRTTYENAVECAKKLKERQIGRVVLVTQAVHLHRAVLCFRKQGVEVVPAGCHYLKTEFKAEVGDFVPSLDGMADCEAATHEWLGLAWYGLRGRI